MRYADPLIPSRLAAAVLTINGQPCPSGEAFRMRLYRLRRRRGEMPTAKDPAPKRPKLCQLSAVGEV